MAWFGKVQQGLRPLYLEKKRGIGMLKTCTVRVEGFSPYSPGKAVLSEKKASESHDEFDRRTWQEKCLTNTDGEVVIPSMSIQRALIVAAKGLDIKINKKGLAGFVEIGCSPTDHHRLFHKNGRPVKLGDMKSETLFVPSDGKALHKGGKGQRVWRTFPIIQSWDAELTLCLLHDALDNKDNLEKLFEQVGKFVGVGRFRPERGGYYGRFSVKSLSLS